MCVDPITGNYAMLASPFEAREALDQGKLVMYGTEDEVAAVATRIRLGRSVQDERRNRRKSQRAARRRNR